MRFPRSCGILLHPTSLPSKYGMGDFGDEAKEFIDFLERTDQTIWQVLPLGPTGYGNSPYASYSAFAGNPYLISLDKLVVKGLLLPEEVQPAELAVSTVAEYEKSYKIKDRLFKLACDRFFKNQTDEQKQSMDQFKNENRFWLEDFCLFMACSIANQRKPWNQWEKGLAQREKLVIDDFRKKHESEINYYSWLQFEFFSQWNEIRDYANKKGIRIIGDIPIFVDHNSSDVWSNPFYFEVDKQGNRQRVSGVPPDYFSKTGQLWGNPLYKWNELEKDGFGWWVERFRQMFELYDAIRVDHFRGFDAYWEISASEKTAIKGKWVKAPGKKLFETIKKELGVLPIIAEDLGVMTPSVEDLRDHFNFPGMKVIQFAFDSDSKNDFLPHNYSQNCVTYTGTHDNDTTIGWFNSAPEPERHRVREYTRSDCQEIEWELIRLGMLSVADQAIFPMQDYMGLGSAHRMNLPATVGNNWLWRYTPDMLHKVDEERIKALVELGNRKMSISEG